MPQVAAWNPGAQSTSLEDADLEEISEESPINGPISLDEAFPSLGPCALCGTEIDARHRVLDAIVGRHTAGDSIESIAEDYNRSPDVIKLVLKEWRG